jgi:acyl-CoA thioester hydrolase
LYKNFFHSTPVQVRFKDIDKQGHVNNANHLSYVETARVYYFADVLGRDVDYDTNGMLLAHAEIDYFEPIFLDEEIIVYTRVSKLGNKSFEIENVIVKKKGDKLHECAKAKCVIVCYNYHAKSTTEIPAEWRNNFTKFEAQQS